MRRTLPALLALLLLLLPAACAPAAEVAPAAPTLSPTAAGTTDEITPAGGAHMGDKLYSPYNTLFDHIQFLPGTFAMDASPYIDRFIEEYEPNDGHDRPSVMYYLAQAMELTREDLEAYYKELGAFDQMTEDMYQGLLTDDLEESMQLLKTPYAFYRGGKLYTVYDLYEMQDAEPAGSFTRDAAYAGTWNAIWEYVSTPKTDLVLADDLIAYVEQRAPIASSAAPVVDVHFTADHFGVCFITADRQVRRVSFSGTQPAEQGVETGILSGLENIRSICAEGDGHIGAIDMDGHFYTTCAIQPEDGDRFIPEGVNVGAGNGQTALAAKEFSGLSDIVFFQSGYPEKGLFVHGDGSATVVSAGADRSKTEEAFHDLVQLAWCGDGAVGLTAQGEVLCGPDAPEECAAWTDVAALYGGRNNGRVFALTGRGTVLSAGEDRWGEGAVDDWEDIVFIASERSFTVGLRADGTVAAAGNNDFGQCDVADWKDIVAVAVSDVRGGAGAAVYTAGIDRGGNLWLAGTVNGMACSGVCRAAAAEEFLDLA